jgi:anti-sigma regulatory factor (Ser/Thr protein kinase)
MKKRLLLRNDIAEIEKLANELVLFGEAGGLPAETVFEIKLALEELIVNVILHGYEDDAEHQIAVEIRLTDEELTMTIEDDGKPFNPLEFRSENIERPFDERETGGMGIHLVRQLMDEVSYQREQGRNVLFLRKQVTGNSSER